MIEGNLRTLRGDHGPGSGAGFQPDTTGFQPVITLVAGWKPARQAGSPPH
jgi:hypothetical protein